ncbi:MAG TPA: enoyl-CoA hydratase-related protein [Acidobacteriota bacterium]|nr:enoyl-CoA hydratase-related protein [Acidobacteriota bacterium]
MNKTMRETTLQTIGLGTVLDIFKNGRLPVDAGDLVNRVFGQPGDRGPMVISGVNGIVGAGKAMQLGARLLPFDVPVVGLDLPGTPDGIGRQYAGLARAFGRAGAGRIMANITQLYYDGQHVPAELKRLKPRFLLEAIPELLEIKKSHYAVFRDTFPEIAIRSVTSGFPSSELGVGIAHPAFPHEINKVWEVVESEPSDITQLFWALGLIPIAVSDHWSFVLDVLFCGLTLASLRFHRASNMPFWKIDKFVRKLIGANPFRAHDAIGAAGANFLTWSCLHHLSGTYGEVFTPTPELVERKDSGQNWYPLNHFRPLVNWSLDADDMDFESWVLGPLFQMTSLMLHEKRGHLAHINAIGELCAQFRRGVLALIRERGADSVIGTVAAYHRLHPEAADGAWFPDAFEHIADPEWQQLYVNAEHDGTIGVITIGRESYNQDVNRELNRAIDWLKAEGIGRVIVTGDFHLATQMVGADISEFFGALENTDKGFEIASEWSRTARRLRDEFAVSVGFVNGKRCLGGFLELLMHCRYLIAVEDADLGMPEVTLPVVPGMEGCHWSFRKAPAEHWPKLTRLLLEGTPVKAREATGWLVDYAGPLEEALQTVWNVAGDGDHGLRERPVQEGAFDGIPKEISGLPETGGAAVTEARGAIMRCIQEACQATLSEALEVQARHSAAFMASKLCRKGQIGAEYTKTMAI